MKFTFEWKEDWKMSDEEWEEYENMVPEWAYCFGASLTQPAHGCDAPVSMSFIYGNAGADSLGVNNLHMLRRRSFWYFERWVC